MLDIRLDKISKSFASDSKVSTPAVINNLSLEIAAGETVALMGPSGSGKSTVLNIIAGLETPDAGDVFLGNNPLGRMSAAAKENFRLHSVSCVFQSFHLLPTLTSLENCVLVAYEQNLRPQQEIVRSALATLEELGLAHAAHLYPAQLSGGMQARVALARALVAAPKLILADEPTGNLDSKTGEQVLDFLFREQRSKNFTLLLVTHDPQAARRAGRIVQLLDGRIVQ